MAGRIAWLVLVLLMIKRGQANQIDVAVSMQGLLNGLLKDDVLDDGYVRSKVLSLWPLS